MKSNIIEPKRLGMICRLIEQPSGMVLGFRKMPSVDKSSTEWLNSYNNLKPKQTVIVVASNKSKNIGDRYYKVIADEGLYWIHLFDLIDVDPETGDIVSLAINITKE